jgi:hypothetical protein
VGGGSERGEGGEGVKEHACARARAHTHTHTHTHMFRNALARKIFSKFYFT